MKRFLPFLCLCLWAVLPAEAQNPSSEFQKGYNITADVSSGIDRVPFLINDVFPGFGLGIGMRYDFHRYWGVRTGLRYEHIFIGGPQHINSMMIPVEMEFHLPHFYAQGGILIGACFDSPIAANAKEMLDLGGTLGLGGRISLTKQDKLTIGVHGTLFCNWQEVNDNGRLSIGFPRYTIMLRVGYEHRF
ncbi:MAG: hypothetical protein K5846_09290 [Bacteroidales bacterium]|nr:hypothetical protein [Bacteroidales bacterium]